MRHVAFGIGVWFSVAGMLLTRPGIPVILAQDNAGQEDDDQPEGGVQGWIRQLGSSDEETRVRAKNALIALGKIAYQPLKRAAMDPRMPGRPLAMEAIGQITWGRAIAELKRRRDLADAAHVENRLAAPLLDRMQSAAIDDLFPGYQFYRLRMRCEELPEDAVWTGTLYAIRLFDPEPITLAGGDFRLFDAAVFAGILNLPDPAEEPWRLETSASVLTLSNALHTIVHGAGEWENAVDIQASDTGWILHSRNRDLPELRLETNDKHLFQGATAK